VARQFSSDGSRRPVFRELTRTALTGLCNAAAALLPQECALCGQEGADVICTQCAPTLPRLGPHCPVCALPRGASAPCAQCLRRAPAYDRTIAPFRYGYPVDRLIQALKYRGRLALAPFFARSLTNTIAPGSADIILPVPLSPRRLRERGFNQALELARGVARPHGGRVDPRLIVRVRDTLVQAALPMAARESNVRHAFDVRAPLQGRCVAVVDDVMTTGATLEEIARVLKQAGAVRVENWVVARAIDH